MLVTCPGCQTKFSLADSALPGDRARVRCSRCGLVFRINRAGEVLGPDQPPPSPPAALPPQPPPAETAAAAPTGEASAEESPAAEPAAPPPRRRRWGRWLSAVLVLAAAAVGGGGWWYAGREPVPALLKPVARLLAPLKLKWIRGTPSPPGSAASPAPEAPEIAAAPPPVTVTPPPPPASPAELQELKVEPGRIQYRILTLPKGGRLLVLRGEVANTGKAPRGPVLLKAALVDARHRPLREETAYSGTTVTEEELRTLDREVIQGWLRTPGGRQRHPTLKPGEKHPFVVIFFDLPDTFEEARPGFQVWPAAGPIVTQSP
jgi:predicted Zn finger-like uncharacterized protein